MKRHPKFSFQRLVGIISKEFLQMRRDRLTFAMMLGIPLIQLTLFGYAINSDPRHLPAAVLLADQGAQGRTLLYAMKNSTYFDFVREVKTEAEGYNLLARGQVQFVINIPQNFSRDLLRGDRPALLVEADATDPSPRWQNRALHSCWLHSGLGHSDRGLLSFSCPDAGQHSSSSGGGAYLHCREPGDGDHLFHHRQEPVTSRTDGFLCFSPV